MDILLQSDSESENDDLLEVTQEIRGKRSNFRNKQLLKMFAIREILKWKYNYFETNAQEHPLYKFCSKAPRGYLKSFAFKKFWRLRMDKEFDTEQDKMHKLFLERQLKKLNDSMDSKASSTIDPSRLLTSYDREVVAMIREVRDSYSSFLTFPERYPLYEIEKKNFLIEQCLAAAHINKTSIRMEDVEKKFLNFWPNRVAELCDLKIAQEKKQIRRDWKQLLPIYHNLGVKDSSSELEGLLSDIESDEDWETDN
jgi:hypothetical protein